MCNRNPDCTENTCSSRNCRCVNGKCVDTQTLLDSRPNLGGCSSNKNCPLGEICSNGICTDFLCSLNIECLPTERCINGKCRPM